MLLYNKHVANLRMTYLKMLLPKTDLLCLSFMTDLVFFAFKHLLKSSVRQ